MKIAFAPLILATSLAACGCASPAVNKDDGANGFKDFATNNNAAHVEAVLRGCAEYVAGVLAERPDLKSEGDAAFLNCIKENGVRSI